MPFRWSARITVTNEGSRPVGSFYYYIDYREVDDLKPEVPYFHAQYRQEFPCEPGKNYLILDAVGRGHYVGCNLSVLQRSMGWWGEGDDMIYVDGEESPSLHGTGSEDYFSDAWGMREGNNLYYGCSIQEEDFQVGAKATVYRFHLADPIPFSQSIRVTIEHGHANDRSDFYSSVAYWYQAEPHKPFPPFSPVDRRLPFALETSDNFTQPLWVKINNVEGNEITYQDNVSGARITAPTLTTILTSYYDQGGQRYQAVGTEGASSGHRAKLTLKASLHDIYDIQVYYLKGPGLGNWSILKEIPKTEEKAISEEEKKIDETQEKVQEKIKEEEKKEAQEKQEQVEPVTPPEPEYQTLARVNGYGPETSIETLTIKAQELVTGENVFWLEVAGKDVRSTASDLAIVGVNLIPARQNFALDWYLIGPFDAPDMNNLTTVYPPEQEIRLNRSYQGKGGLPVAWKQVKAPASGYVALSQLIQPNEQAIAYGLTYLYSPQDREVVLLLGSDDGVRLWVNDNLVHTNPSYRGAYPDQDRVKVSLKAGWNKVLIKVLQGAGGWGYYLRIPDPKGEYRWSARPSEK
ncbi:MAG: glycoside hydrolase family 172 protein [Candidatus Aenigmatarchaeota archaeon]